eukprot:1321889-Amphidinium_carterae.1
MPYPHQEELLKSAGVNAEVRAVEDHQYIIGISHRGVERPQKKLRTACLPQSLGHPSTPQPEVARACLANIVHAQSAMMLFACNPGQVLRDGSAAVPAGLVSKAVATSPKASTHDRMNGAW